MYNFYDQIDKIIENTSLSDNKKIDYIFNIIENNKSKINSSLILFENNKINIIDIVNSYKLFNILNNYIYLLENFYKKSKENSDDFYINNLLNLSFNLNLFEDYYKVYYIENSKNKEVLINNIIKSISLDKIIHLIDILNNININNTNMYSEILNNMEYILNKYIENIDDESFKKIFNKLNNINFEKLFIIDDLNEYDDKISLENSNSYFSNNFFNRAIETGFIEDIIDNQDNKVFTAILIFRSIFNYNLKINNKDIDIFFKYVEKYLMKLQYTDLLTTNMLFSDNNMFNNRYFIKKLYRLLLDNLENNSKNLQILYNMLYLLLKKDFNKNIEFIEDIIYIKSKMKSSISLYNSVNSSLLNSNNILITFLLTLEDIYYKYNIDKEVFIENIRKILKNIENDKIRFKYLTIIKNRIPSIEKDINWQIKKKNLIK